MYTGGLTYVRNTEQMPQTRLDDAIPIGRGHWNENRKDRKLHKKDVAESQGDCVYTTEGKRRSFQALPLLNPAGPAWARSGRTAGWPIPYNTNSTTCWTHSRHQNSWCWLYRTIIPSPLPVLLPPLYIDQCYSCRTLGSWWRRVAGDGETLRVRYLRKIRTFKPLLPKMVVFKRMKSRLRIEMFGNVKVNLYVF